MSDDSTYSAPGLKVVSLGSRGRGVVAERNFKKGEVIAIWRGSIITESEAIALPESERNQLLQVGDISDYLLDRRGRLSDFVFRVDVRRVVWVAPEARPTRRLRRSGGVTH